MTNTESHSVADADSSSTHAEWPDEQRSCMRRKSTVTGGSDGKQEWLEDQAYCILNSVTIAGAG